MAAELRWEHLFDTDSSNGSANAAAEFRNDTSVMIHIREINWTIQASTGANDEQIFSEISKSPVLASRTNNNVFFAYGQSVGISAGTTGSGADDVATGANGGRKYGRGQLTLEPGESLYVNWVKSSGLTINITYSIGYEFA